MKRIIAMALCIAIFATMAITGSVAYLTDEEKETNVFAVGNVDIVQHEQERNGTKLQDFTNDLTNLRHPMVESRTETQKTTGWPFDGSTVNLRNPDYYANYVDKIVTVENKGTSPVYLRNIIAIPTGLPEGADDVEWLEIDWFDMPGETSSEWKQAKIEKDVLIDGVLYDIYVFNYIADDGVFEAKDSTLPTLLGFGLSKYVDYDDTEGAETYFFRDASGKRTDIKITPEEMKILVATQAVQAAGFEDFGHAFDETFGEISVSNHPWYKEADSYAYIGDKKYTWEELTSGDSPLILVMEEDPTFLYRYDPSITKLHISGNQIKTINPIYPANISSDSYQLTELSIGAGVERIGNLAFNGITSLKSIAFPATPITVGQSAFQKTGFTEITLPSNVVLDEAGGQFYDCESLTTVVLNDGFTTVPKSCFYSCGALKTVILSNTLTSIKTQAFGFCEALESIALPSSLKTIEASAFTWCGNLSSIGPFTNVTSIGDNAFRNCNDLKEIYLPETLKATVEANKSTIFPNCKNITIKLAA